MVSRSWCIVMVVLACFQYRVAADCKVAGHEGESCHQCYQTLESYLLNTSDNKYQLRRVFYPLEVVAPVFVTVRYQYIGTNTTKLWFWSTGIFYFLQPIEVFQFTSLFFGNPSWRSSKVNITLPSECVNASNEFMTELTQLLKLYAATLKANPEIDSTYQADGLNMETLDSELYTDITFFDVRHPDLLYCFQMLFPPFTIVLLVVYGCASHYTVKAYVEKHTTCCSSWATATAHAVICLAFTVFVVVLDIVALVFRKEAPDYYTASFNALLFHYPGLTLFWDGFALTTTMTVMIVVMIVWGCCQKNELSCPKKNVNKNEIVFLLLLLAGVVPLLCIASHVHYIFIAAITDPLYATGIGLYYGIFYYVHLSLLKQTYEGVDKLSQVQTTKQSTTPQQGEHTDREGVDKLSQVQTTKQSTTPQQGEHTDREGVDKLSQVQTTKQSTTPQQGEHTNREDVAPFNCKAMICVFVVLFVTVCYQILLTTFYVFLPINNSVENVPLRIFLILQVASAILLSLLAYKIAFGLRETPSLSAISRAIRNFLLKKDENSNLHNKRNWDSLDEDKKLTHLLCELYDNMIIRATLVNQQPHEDQPPQKQPPQQQSQEEQPPQKQPPQKQQQLLQVTIELQQRRQQQTSDQQNQQETPC